MTEWNQQVRLKVKEQQKVQRMALSTQKEVSVAWNDVDGAGCNLVVMDYHRMIATGWPVAQLLKFHWDNSLLTE